MEVKNMPIIDKVIPLDGYKVLIELKNGHSIILDFENKLDTLRFSELENKDLFRKVKTDGFTLLWNKGKLKVSIGEILQMLQDIKSLFKVV